MEKDWVQVYLTDKGYLAEILKDMLFDNDIQAIIMNKKDSAYVSIGDVELYVKKDDAVKAKFLIEKSEN